jgi:hypothetical protein
MGVSRGSADLFTEEPHFHGPAGDAILAPFEKGACALGRFAAKQIIHGQGTQKAVTAVTANVRRAVARAQVSKPRDAVAMLPTHKPRAGHFIPTF